jgi:hypothetical protein
MTEIPLNDEWTHISVLIDRSGSMQKLNPDNIAKELTNFIKTQNDDKVTVSASRFDNEYEKFLNYIPSSEFNITGKDIEPRGMTALTESLCRLIDDTGKELSNMTNERPGKVIVVVLTDGEENSSSGKYSGVNGKKLLKDKITHQKEKYNWVFFFMGTNIDAVTIGEELGIDKRTCITFDNDEEMCSNVIKCASKQVFDIRKLKRNDMLNESVLYNTAGFTKEQRDVVKKNIYSVLYDSVYHKNA